MELTTAIFLGTILFAACIFMFMGSERRARQQDRRAARRRSASRAHHDRTKGEPAGRRQYDRRRHQPGEDALA